MTSSGKNVKSVVGPAEEITTIQCLELGSVDLLTATMAVSVDEDSMSFNLDGTSAVVKSHQGLD